MHETSYGEFFETKTLIFIMYIITGTPSILRKLMMKAQSHIISKIFLCFRYNAIVYTNN